MSGLSLVSGGGMARGPEGVGDPGRAGGEQAVGVKIDVLALGMLPRLRPRCFYDLVIEVAIVRPGPI